MLRMVEPDPGAIRPALLQRRELRMGTETGHAAGIASGGAGVGPQVGVACRTRAIGDHRERISVSMLAVAVHAVRCISGYLPAMMSESLVAADTGLVHGHVGAVLIGGDETAEWLPWSDVTILAVESSMDLGERAGCMDSMLTQPNIIGHPTEREDQSNDESDRRAMCGNRGDDASGDASEALDSRPCGHETSWTEGSCDRVLMTHPMWRNRRIATHGRPDGRRQKYSDAMTWAAISTKSVTVRGA